ncbi:hypothetical protein GGX14DRAFT_672895 [Mycena pura]|uniref:F-box domain-containing protein n=1 Tax=Mycena pura TaxID=153505 RepID=A0AAD6V0A5_9AGAR|nr:hypothetical protein GGX14DRAFT_672895 [Mycena pura]
MEFQDLPEDVLRAIFNVSDIYAVVSMSRANKYLRQLAVDKLVWVDLVENLLYKGFVDRLTTSKVHSYSQEGLVALVKRLLVGPQCWNPPSKAKSHFRLGLKTSDPKSQSPAPAQTVLHPSDVVTSKANEAKLLRGGEYVLFNNRTLECWSVRHDRLVWAYDKRPGWHSVEFAADVVNGGYSANIIVCECKWEANGDTQWYVFPACTVQANKHPHSKTASFVQIVNLDFRTAVSTTLLLAPLLDSASCICNTVDICGPFASATFEDHGNRRQSCSMLINWQTQSHLKLVSDDLDSPQLVVALIPSNVLVLTNNASGCPELRVVDVGAHSRRIADTPNVAAVQISRLHTVMRERITFGHSARFRDPARRELYAYPSPIEDGTFRVWVRMAGYERSSFRLPSSALRRAVLVSYHLSLPRRAGERMALRRRTAANASPACSGLSYSGHSHEYVSFDEQRVFSAGELQPVASFHLRGSVGYAHISTYSGAITYPDRNVYVSYFE